MLTEALGVMADFMFNHWDLGIFCITVFGTYHGASVIMCRAFNWKRLSISMLDVELCIVQMSYMTVLATFHGIVPQSDHNNEHGNLETTSLFQVK
jgi:hypothetical protein